MTYLSQAVDEDEGATLETTVERFRVLLDSAWAADNRRRTTTVGPHRDEIAVTVDDGAGEISVRSYGSGGQRRSVALALRLVEAATIRRSRGVEPLLLLDDAFAELDEHRTGRVMALIQGEGTGQVIATAPKESSAKMLHVRFSLGENHRPRGLQIQPVGGREADFVPLLPQQ